MKYFIYFMVFFICHITFAQHSLKGQITNAETNTPIEFASIYFPQLEKGTVTTSNGAFSINDIANGTYKMIVSIVGYETKAISVTLPRDAKIEIALMPSAIEIEEVIISTPFHKLQSENVMKVEQEKISTLKNKGAVTLSDGITQIAGIESISTGLGIGKPVIRGLSANRVLVYTQGIRLENQQFGDEHGLGVNAAGVESVEVIKGPASLLYGSDALGGVIYINPERYANENSKEATFNSQYFTNTEGTASSIGYKASTNAFKFLFRGSYSAHSDYKNKNYRVTNTRFNELDFKGGIGYQANAFKTDFRYNTTISKLGIPEELGVQSISKTPLLPSQEIGNHVFSSKSTVFFNNSSLDFNLGFIYNDRKEFEEEHGDEDSEEEEHDENEILAPALHMILKTANYDIKYHLPTLGKFETIIGIQGLNQTNTNRGEEQLIPDAETNDFGALATSHIHFENLDIQLGARFDYRKINVFSDFSNDYTSFNGAFGLKTKVFKNIITRLNIASGFRAPNLAELSSFGTHEGTNRFEIGNKNLNNEQNIQTDLALEYRNDHLEIFVNGFYNAIANYIFLNPTTEVIDNNPVFRYIQNDARLFGGEIGVHLHPHPLDWLHIESSFETVTGKQSKEFLPLIPANSLTNTLRVEFKNKAITNGFAFVRLRSTFKQNNISTNETTTDGYQLLSAGFGGELRVFSNPLTLTVNATNILNTTYINHLSRLKPDGLFNIGRNLSISLNYKL